jgi:transcriptional regulator with XRE-family HTH domain
MKKTIHSREYAAVLRLLRERRRESGMSQVELAKRLGLTQSQVSKFERGEKRLDIVELRAVCSAIGVGLAEFIRKLDQQAAK